MARIKLRRPCQCAKFEAPDCPAYQKQDSGKLPSDCPRHGAPLSPADDDEMREAELNG